MSQIILVKTKEEAKMRARQERRENARRIRDGLPPKPLITFINEGSHRPKKRRDFKPKPKKAPTPQEQKVLQNTLKKSVKVVAEGQLVDSSNEVKDTTPAEPSRAERIAEQRERAQKRRKQLKSKE